MRTLCLPLILIRYLFQRWILTWKSIVHAFLFPWPEVDYLNCSNIICGDNSRTTACNSWVRSLLCLVALLFIIVDVPPVKLTKIDPEKLSVRTECAGKIFSNSQPYLAMVSWLIADGFFRWLLEQNGYHTVGDATFDRVRQLFLFWSSASGSD